MQNASVPEIRELTLAEIEAVSGGVQTSGLSSLSGLICQIERSISCVISQLSSIFGCRTTV